MNRVVFSSQSINWATPVGVYKDLDDEFFFDLDPCPLGSKEDGLAMSWSNRRVYCNPPYGRTITKWLDKAAEAKLAVFLLPAKTDTRWFHDYCLRCAKEIRFVRGRLRFGDAKHNAPFPSMIVIFK